MYCIEQRQGFCTWHHIATERLEAIAIHRARELVLENNRTTRVRDAFTAETVWEE